MIDILKTKARFSSFVGLNRMTIFQFVFRHVFLKTQMWPVQYLIDMVTNGFYSTLYDDNICGNKAINIFAFLWLFMSWLRIVFVPFIAMFCARKNHFFILFFLLLHWQLDSKLNSITDLVNKAIDSIRMSRCSLATHILILKQT